MNTPRFKEQGAHYAKQPLDSIDDYDLTQIEIDDADQKQLREEILKSRNVHIGLIDELKKLDE